MSDPRGPAGSGASDGAEHDAWLREALRHAPDAQVGPPANVSRLIMAEARSQARVRSSPNSHELARALLAFWSWLARPPVAAGFASVMAATLVGMMWWDRPMDETMPKAPPMESRAPAAPAPQAAPVAAPATAPTIASPTAPAVGPRASLAEPQQVAPARESSSRGRLALKKEDARDAARPSNAAPPAETAQAGEPSAFPQPPRTTPPVMRRLARPEPLVEPAPSTTPDTAAVTGAAALQDVLKERSVQPVARDRAESNAYAPPPPAAPGAARSDSASGLLAAKAAAPRARPLASMLSGLRDDASRWQRAGSARPIEPDGALVRWLAELDAASAASWQSLPAAGAGTPSGAAALELQRDGATVASLRIEGDAFELESRADGAARRWRAELPAPVAARLRTSLPRSPP